MFDYLGDMLNTFKQLYSVTDSLSIAPAKVCATEKSHHAANKRNAKVTASAVVDS